MSNKDIKIALVAAVAKNGIIGRDGDMPWRLSTDLKRFKAVTLGKPVIMGRKTYESIGRLLPGRLNIIVSRSGFEIEGAVSASSLEAAIDLARSQAAKDDMDEICVIGGGQIYTEAIDMADRLYITHVLAMPDGDTSFPVIMPHQWVPTTRETVPISDKDTAETVYAVYERVK